LQGHPILARAPTPPNRVNFRRQAEKEGDSYLHDPILKGFNGGILKDSQLATEGLHALNHIANNPFLVVLPITLGIPVFESDLELLKQCGLSSKLGSFGRRGWEESVSQSVSQDNKVDPLLTK